MEAAPPLDRELIVQRAQAASFIQRSLQPAEHVFEEVVDDQEFEERDYQLDAWSALWEAREQGETSALVTLATGLGKTSIATVDVKKFREELREQEGREPRVMFVCHQDKILEQAAKRFDAFIPDMSQGYYTGEVKDKDQDITFATFQSLERNLKDFDPFEFDYIVYDEAHHSQADTWHRVVRHFNPDFQLALTATPDRMDGLEILDLFGREVYAKGLGEALAEGLLTDVDYHIVFDDAVKQALEDGFHPKSMRELKELLTVPRRNSVIAKNIQEEMEKIGAQDAKTIIFCNDIPHANRMASLLGGKAYHSDLSKKDRSDVMSEFKEGDLQIICTRDMFNEGIDVPDANLLVFLRSTQSKTVFEQQLGRGLRKHPGKEKVSVLDFVGNIRRLQELLDLSTNVTALASEFDLDKLIAEGDRPRTQGALNVSTGHTSFDFERLAVDLLDTYQSLIFEPVPEGYVNVSAFARELGVTYSTLKGLIAHHQIETGKHIFGSSVGVSLSPESQEYIRTLEGLVKPAPEGYLSATMLAREFCVKSNTLMKHLKGHKLPLERHIYSGHVCISFGPAAQAMARQIVPPVEDAPEGYSTIPDFAQELGIEDRLLIRLIREQGVPFERHRYNTRAERSLSPETQDQIRQLEALGEPMPDDYQTMNAFARHIGVAPGTIASRLKILGIEASKHRLPGSHIAATLSPAIQQQLLEAYPERITEAPEGYMTISQFMKDVGLGEIAVKSAIEEAGIEPELMYFGERRSTGKGLSPEAQALLREKLKDLIVPSAPVGYVSVPVMAKRLNSSTPKLLEAIIMNGIEAERHRFRSQYSLSLSPEAQAKISAIYETEKVSAPEGYVSVSAFAEQAGMAYERVTALIEEHDVETGEFIFGKSRQGAGLSPEAQEQLLTLRGEVVEAPEDFKSVTVLGKEWGLSWNLLKQLITEHDIETGAYTYRGRIGAYLSPGAQEQLKQAAQPHFLEILPDGYVTITEFSKTHSLAQATYERLAEESGVNPGVYKTSGKRRMRVKGLSPEDQQKLTATMEKSLAPAAPEGYVSIIALSRQLKTSKTTLDALIDEHGIETTWHRFSSIAATSLSPDVQTKLSELLEKRRNQ